MKVTFELTRKDMWKQHWWAHWNMPKNRINIIIFCLIMLGFSTNEISNQANYFLIIINALLTIILCITLLSVIPALLIAITVYRMEKRHGVIGEHIVKISAEGIREQTYVNDNLSRWVSIDSIKSSKEYIYCCRDRSFLGIPKKAFENKMEADQFLNMALHFLQETKKNNKDIKI